MEGTQQGQGLGGKHAFEYCDCNWMDDEPFSGGTTMCGCGEHHARGYRDNLVHWDGKHWRMTCALTEALRRLKDAEQRAGVEQRDGLPTPPAETPP